MSARLSFTAFLLLTALAVARIVSTYRWVAQTVDETPNIACGMQWLDQGRYDYGPFHPPLARIAMSVGPYLYGVRSQGLPDRWKEGNAILHSKRYSTALTLARLGILPFFILAVTCVWLWSRRLAGEWGALVAVLVFTNVPPVLAHAGIATTDMALTAGVIAALYAFVRWLEQPDVRRSLILGVALALAFLTKFSAVLFVPVCAIVALYCFRKRLRNAARLRLLAISAGVCFLLVWAAYRFTWGRMTVPAVSAPFTFLSSVPVPAPAILDGLQIDVTHNGEGHPAYLLGRFSRSGWWYFFPLAVSLKTPLAMLILAAFGMVAAARRSKWQLWIPPVCALGIVAVCMPAHLNIGVRYVLPIYPLLSITAAMGAVWLFGHGRGSSIMAATLLLWMTVSSVRAHPDYIPYFNEIAQREPERFLVDSDLDWGQDTKRLTRKLKELAVKRLHLACLWTLDDSKLDLPSWDGLEPYERVTGWIAISLTTLKMHGLNIANAWGRPEPAFAWLDQYKPVAKVGKSILIYYIPESEPRTPNP